MKRIMVAIMVMVVPAMIFSIAERVMAQDKPIELKYASIYPPSHAFSIADQHYMQKIEKETNGRVKFINESDGTYGVAIQFDQHRFF